MSENTPPVQPSGYDTVLQVLSDMRREHEARDRAQAARDEAQAARDEQTHGLLEALVSGLEAHDQTLRELTEAAKPPKDGGKGLRELLQELFTGIEQKVETGFADQADRLQSLPEEVASKVVVEVEPASAAPQAAA